MTPKHQSALIAQYTCNFSLFAERYAARDSVLGADVLRIQGVHEAYAYFVAKHEK